MKATMNYNQIVNMLYGYGQGYCGLTKEQYEQKKESFKTIISEASTKDFIVTLTDGTALTLRLFVSDCDNVCFYAKGARSKGYMINLGKVERIEAKLKKDQDKFKTFHRNCEKAASLLAISGLWPEIRKRMEVMAAMPVEEYNRLMTLWQVYDELYSHRELTYDERDRLQEEKRKEYEAYFTERGATGDWYHFRQLSDNKQIVSIPYGKWNQDVRQRVEKALERARQAEGDYEQETARWRGSYDFSVGVRKRNGELMGWYSAEYKNCGNGHYYLLLDATHAIYCEDD